MSVNTSTRQIGKQHLRRVMADRHGATVHSSPLAARPPSRSTRRPGSRSHLELADPHRDVQTGDPMPAASTAGALTTTTCDTDDSFVRSLYTRYAGPLRSIVLRLTGGDRHWAEDVVQETLLRAWRNIDRLMPASTSRSLMPWLATVAWRIVMNDRRSRKARPKEVGDTLIDLTPVPDSTEQVLTQVILREALKKLTPAHRRVVVEMYLHGRTVDEVARMLGIPSGTVKSRTYYALRVMRAALQQQGVTG